VTKPPPMEKLPTRIAGLDVATYGGLPRAGTTLIAGAAGSGKTVMALQIVALAAGAGIGSVVMSFEEPPDQLRRNASGFPWGDALDAEDRVRFADGRPLASTYTSGAFDLEGCVAVLDALVGEVDASWVVVDGIDQILAEEPDRKAAIREIARLDAWSRRRNVALLLTGKRVGPGDSGHAYLQAVEFLLSTVVTLSVRHAERRVSRTVQVVKYRGSRHVGDEIPMVLGRDGVDVFRATPLGENAATQERISSGVAALDEVLGGGIYRGSTLLLSGAPGTSKSTLASSFAHAATQRGEQVLYVSFDESAEGIRRNAASVGLDLGPAITDGRLVLDARSAWESAPEDHVIEIQRLLVQLQPKLLVIDPVSALLDDEGVDTSIVLGYLLRLTRSTDVTTVLTSLTSTGVSSGETTASRASTIADTWISLEYRILAGERNRALSVVKSRGTAHSNVVRELMLGSHGIDLVETYRQGATVLFGSARIEAEAVRVREAGRAGFQRDRSERELEARVAVAVAEQRRAGLDAERLRIELEALRDEGSEARDYEVAGSTGASGSDPEGVA